MKRDIGIPDSLSDTATSVTRQRIVEIADEIITVVFWQAHERAAHHDEFHFVDTMTQLLQLNRININTPTSILKYLLKTL